MAKTVSEGILRGIDAYSKARQARQGDLGDQLKMFETMRKLKAYNEPLPQGFIRVDGKPMPDPSFQKPLSQMEQYKIKQDEAKSAQAESVRQKSNELLKVGAEDSLNTIKKIKEGINFFGPFGPVPSIVAPSSVGGMGDYAKRSEWENNIKKLKSQMILDIMNKMKSASKTGATGFGQLSNKELGILTAASTALDRNLTPEAAKPYLDELERIHKKFLYGAQIEEELKRRGISQ